MDTIGESIHNNDKQCEICLEYLNKETIFMHHDKCYCIMCFTCCNPATKDRHEVTKNYAYRTPSQIINRLHRIGKTESLVIVNLIIKNSTELECEKMLDKTYK